MPSNQAAWLTEKGAPLSISSAPYNEPSPMQILIKAHAIAINPVDWGMQLMGKDLFPFINFPIILGCDVAGEVISVGSSITRVKLGDRVLGMATVFQKESAAFQEYVLLEHNVFSQIPDSVSYEEACVLPLGLSTAASGLFQPDMLALPYPKLEPEVLGKTLIVWSGASSVGANAIQLGVAAGCEVVTTCSEKNFEMVKKLGASAAFDYGSETVVQDILKYLEGKEIVGAVGIGSVNATLAGNGNKSSEMVLEIVSKSKGRKFVAMAMLYTGPVPDGVEQKFIQGGSLTDNELGLAIYEAYLPKALAEGKFVAAPEPLVVGKGFESIQKAFEVQMKGVSGKKVVVSL